MYKIKNIEIQILLTVFIAFTLISCNKETVEKIKEEARIIYEGDPSVDGCGWLVETNTATYKPVELNKDFQINGILVNIEYETLSSEWNCGWQTTGYQEIKINNITIK